jgi:hypothetical protein
VLALSRVKFFELSYGLDQQNNRPNRRAAFFCRWGEAGESIETQNTGGSADVSKTKKKKQGGWGAIK